LHTSDRTMRCTRYSETPPLPPMLSASGFRGSFGERMLILSSKMSSLFDEIYRGIESSSTVVTECPMLGRLRADQRGLSSHENSKRTLSHIDIFKDGTRNLADEIDRKCMLLLPECPGLASLGMHCRGFRCDQVCNMSINVHQKR
jgi:hypothetical protein